jgi:hypothetical protein
VHGPRLRVVGDHPAACPFAQVTGVTSPDAWVCVYPHGYGEAGDRPAAILEVWMLEDGRVTFGGLLPRGTEGWAALIYRLVAAEAARCAQRCPEHDCLKADCGCP